ncbi:hypothetical protein HDU81_002118 [Chytriomyces hyalinus]|nr:hypothetical protein HDU81_002118 [Chytriomyces hyalinus]
MCAQTDGTSSNNSDCNNADNEIEAIFSNFPTYTDWCFQEGNQQSTLEQYHDELYTHAVYLANDTMLPQDAFPIFKYLANNGHARGMNEYGTNLVSGDIPDECRDASEGLAWVEKSAKLGYAKAQRNLAVYLYEGILCEQNGFEALRWGYTAIEQGYVEAYCTIGCMYLKGNGVPSDLPKAVEMFQRGMDAGSIECVSLLGLLYQGGRGVAKNVPKAVELYEKAIDLGDLVGYDFLGNLFVEGDDGIPKDLSRAAMYYELAAEANVVSAMRNLDYAKAREFFERAAQHKHEEAICALGFLLGEGLGCVKDPVRAAKLYQESAALGCGLGAYNAGAVFENGQGVPVNLLKALEYYKQAMSLNCNLPEPSLQPNSHLVTKMHSVGITYLKENKRKEANDHLKAAAQLGHAKSVVELYISALWGMEAVPFDTTMRYFTPPQAHDTTLSILPMELVTGIFQWLHPKQCIQLRATSRRLLALVDNDWLARHVLQFNACLIPSQARLPVHWFDKLLFHGPHAFQVAYVEMRLNGIREIGCQERKYVSHTEYGLKRINVFPAAFVHWTSLTSLQVSGIGLAGAIPESIKYLRNLKEVDLSRNK